jgi:hypothetical protein
MWYEPDHNIIRIPERQGELFALAERWEDVTSKTKARKFARNCRHATMRLVTLWRFMGQEVLVEKYLKNQPVQENCK